MYSYNYIKPKKKSEARIWNKYNSQNTWDFIQIRYWPADIAEAVITKKLNYKMRFRTFLYLMGNGMDPRMARNEVLKMGVDYFDHSAREHIRGLYKDLNRNMKKWSYWDERERKIMFLEETAPIERVDGERLIKKKYNSEGRRLIADNYNWAKHFQDKFGIDPDEAGFRGGIWD